MKRTRAIARKSLRFGAAVILLVVLPGGFDRVHAQIYQWQDEVGDHFETSLDQVPEEHRAQARIVVPSSAASSTGQVSEGNPTTAPQPSTDQTAAENGFASGWEQGFRAGWESGYRVAAEEQPECPAEPAFVALQNPPVLESPAPVVASLVIEAPFESVSRVMAPGAAPALVVQAPHRGSNRLGQLPLASAAAKFVCTFLRIASGLPVASPPSWLS